jgi:hypothetical protein
VGVICENLLLYNDLFSLKFMLCICLNIYFYDSITVCQNVIRNKIH